MSEDHSNFKAIVAHSPFLTERLQSLIAQVQSDGEKFYGIKPTADEVLSLSEIRIATLGTELDRPSYEAQFQAMSIFQPVIQKRLVEAGNVQAQAAAVLSVLDIPSRADRISAARKKGVASVGAESDGSGLSKAEKIALLMQISNPAARLSQARLWRVC